MRRSLPLLVGSLALLSLSQPRATAQAPELCTAAGLRAAIANATRQLNCAANRVIPLSEPLRLERSLTLDSQNRTRLLETGNRVNPVVEGITFAKRARPSAAATTCNRRGANPNHTNNHTKTIQS